MTPEELELTQLAAKAAGIKLEHIDGIGWGYWPESGGDFHFWYPAYDDGDSFRLAVKLRLRVHTDNLSDAPKAVAFRPEFRNSFAYFSEEPHGADPCAATRMAVLRAAAEMGRRMP